MQHNDYNGSYAGRQCPPDFARGKGLLPLLLPADDATEEKRTPRTEWPDPPFLWRDRAPATESDVAEWGERWGWERWMMRMGEYTDPQTGETGDLVAVDADSVKAVAAALRICPDTANRVDSRADADGNPGERLHMLFWAGPGVVSRNFKNLEIKTGNQLIVAPWSRNSHGGYYRPHTGFLSGGLATLTTEHVDALETALGKRKRKVDLRELDNAALKEYVANHRNGGQATADLWESWYGDEEIPRGSRWLTAALLMAICRRMFKNIRKGDGRVTPDGMMRFAQWWAIRRLRRGTITVADLREAGFDEDGVSGEAYAAFVARAVRASWRDYDPEKFRESQREYGALGNAKYSSQAAIVHLAVWHAFHTRGIRDYDELIAVSAQCRRNRHGDLIGGYCYKTIDRIVKRKTPPVCAGLGGV